MDPIRFYRVNEPHGCFSNFSPHPITLDGLEWPTSEHYFQAQKFLSAEHQEEVRAARSPMIAARMGRERSRPLRPDWEQVKDEAMLRAVHAKVAQHSSVRALLLETDDAELIEHTANDPYWGDGGDGRGRNMLGQILMRVWDGLRAPANPALGAN